ncbi:5'-phosphate synthase pdxT subunit [Candidatus Hakubella thermalkaliphila]|uniref:glutaminase n=1 Tax=Candidatus Hakubella thermalkaliphila TaxID=2754717 RepID=A0A6V8PCC9_9ACTN|nr:hypothetical protein [Candidatus Hakubella thermalkaliphila]GFP28506.1 5'-phosphate synthase pdxT subunit [Candidatus Hakubella thermalkaliphila]
MKIDVLAIQGAVREHETALQRCVADVVLVKKAKQFAGLDGLVIPGGESTTIGRLLVRFSLVEPILQLISQAISDMIMEK